MSDKALLEGHPLFTNRHRVLAIPAQAARPELNRGRAWLASIAVGLGIFGIFLAGYCAANPLYAAAFVQSPGRLWQDTLQQQMGQDMGAALADKSPWIMARVGGIAAYIGVFASVVLGLAISLRLTDRVLHRASLVYLHRILALEVLVFTVAHIAGLVLDSYLNISLSASLTPFGVDYRTVWTGLGTLSLYVIIAIVVSVYFANRMGYRLWRLLHYASFLIFASAFAHGLMTGSDSQSDWMRAVYMLTGAIVCLMLGMRLTTRLVPRR